MNYLRRHSDTILFVCGITLITLGLYWVWKALKKWSKEERTRYGFSFLYGRMKWWHVRTSLKVCEDVIRKFYNSYYEINKKGEINMDAINVSANHDEITLEFTKRTDEILHMILDLKQDKEVDLYRLQTLVLNEYKDIIELLHVVDGLQHELENRKRKIIEIPKFMFQKETQWWVSFCSQFFHFLL